MKRSCRCYMPNNTTSCFPLSPLMKNLEPKWNYKWCQKGILTAREAIKGPPPKLQRQSRARWRTLLLHANGRMMGKENSELSAWVRFYWASSDLQHIWILWKSVSDLSWWKKNSIFSEVLYSILFFHFFNPTLTLVFVVFQGTLT